MTQTPATQDRRPRSGSRTSAKHEPRPKRPFARKVLEAVRRFPTAASAIGPFVVADRDRHKGRPILVHQMGKVASTSVAKAIAATTERPVYHLHFLSDEGLKFADRAYRSNWDERNLPWHVWESKYTRRLLRNSDEWEVVTVVRDPIARNVSQFFQTATLQHHLDPARLSTDELRRHFFETYDEHDRPLTWLDDEIDGPFGTDVFATSFPSERGWDVVDGTIGRVAVIRYEDLATATRPAIEALLGVDVGDLPAANTSAGKSYGANHRAFMASPSMPDAYLDMMYGSKYALHFYTPTEREAFRARWA